MNLDELRIFADEQLSAFGLTRQGWRFGFDRARARFGCCRYDLKSITISRTLAEANDAAECRDTVLHEIAHALAGKSAGHGPKWKRACRLVGAEPVRCYTTATVKQPDPKYWAVCPRCENRTGYFKRPRAVRACRQCCTRHNGGRYDERFRLRILDALTGEEIGQVAHTSKGARTPLYIGTCPHCNTRYPFYRRQNFNKACGSCCRRYAGGRFDARFKLQISRIRPEG